MNQGWECPRCHKINAPSVVSCSCPKTDKEWLCPRQPYILDPFIPDKRYFPYRENGTAPYRFPPDSVIYCQATSRNGLEIVGVG